MSNLPHGNSTTQALFFSAVPCDNLLSSTMKRQSKNLLLDRMHRGVVYTCMGLTLYGTYMLGVRVFRYFTVIKPARQAEELRMLEAGAPSQAPSLDKAPTLTS